MADEAELARKQSENEIKRSRVRHLSVLGARRGRHPLAHVGRGATRWRLVFSPGSQASRARSPGSGSGRGGLRGRLSSLGSRMLHATTRAPLDVPH